MFGNTDCLDHALRHLCNALGLHSRYHSDELHFDRSNHMGRHARIKHVSMVKTRLSTVRSSLGSGHSGQNLDLDLEVWFRYLKNLDLDPRVQVRTSVRP
jgi:hypothetical protein